MRALGKSGDGQIDIKLHILGRANHLPLSDVILLDYLSRFYYADQRRHWLFLGRVDVKRNGLDWNFPSCKHHPPGEISLGSF